MKKCILFLAMLLALCFALTGCDSGSSGGDDPAPVAVESVSLDKAALVLKTGTDGILTATVLPENATDKSVTWSSDDEVVATVDQTGKVTGVSSGTATITVTTNDGGKTASCVVTVSAEVYTVKFDVQGHGTAPEDLTVLPGDKVTKPADPAAGGFAFIGWCKEKACVTEWKFDTDTVTVDNTILYAKWIENPCMVSFVGNNGGSDTMEPEPVRKGDSYTVSASTFAAPPFTAKEGAVPATHKNFAGWTAKADGTGAKYMPGDMISDITADITLYAQWEKPYFSVSQNKSVYFSKGNLYWDGSKFDFEAKQYDSPSTWSTTHVGTFYWSKNESTAYAADFSETQTLSDILFTNKTTTTPKPDFTVAGISGKYMSLSADEWRYLVSSRSASTIGTTQNARYAKVKVDGKVGVLIFPDVFSWTSEMGVVPTKFNENTTAGSYTATEFAAMEAAGAVFILGTVASRYSASAGSTTRSLYHTSEHLDMFDIDDGKSLMVPCFSVGFIGVGIGNYGASMGLPIRLVCYEN